MKNVRPHVERVGNHDLTMEVWDFWFDERYLRIVLDRYARFERATKRHKWVCRRIWSRSDGRVSTMRIVDVPLPAHATDDALAQFRAAITIQTEEELHDTSTQATKGA